jgi:hypothetical protein
MKRVISKLLERLIMSLTGKMISAFPIAATEIKPNDLFGIAQDVGGGVFQTKKAARKLLPDITTISRTTDLVRAAAVSGDDDQLFFPVVAGSKYFIRTRLIYDIVTPNGVVTYQWTVPAVTSANQDILYFQAGALVWKRGHSSGPILLANISDALSSFLIATDSLVIVPSADGTIALNWGAIANTVTLKSGSWIDVVKQTP